MWRPAAVARFYGWKWPLRAGVWLAIALVAARNLALLAVVLLSVRELQPRRHQELLDGARPALAVRLD